MTLKGEISRDIDGVFLNADEYAETLEIGTNSANAVTVLGSLQANEIDNTSGQGNALQTFSHALYCAYPIGGELKLLSGQILYVNKIAYKVIDFEDFMGLATIHLSKKGG